MRSCALGWLALVASALTAGCNEPPAVNPWRDDSIPPSTYGTASSEFIASANRAPATRTRDIPPSPAPVARLDVPHYPLWWEDPFEDQGDNNSEFAWTWQDYLHMPYGLGRFIVNTTGWPVSAVVTPPGTPMVSDATVEKVHDARPGKSPDPTATFDDFIPPEATSAEAAATPQAPAEAVPPQ